MKEKRGTEKTEKGKNKVMYRCNICGKEVKNKVHSRAHPGKKVTYTEIEFKEEKHYMFVPVLLRLDFKTKTFEIESMT